MCGFKIAPCVHSKRPRVCRHHAHMCFNMCAWCRYTRERFERSHGDVLNAHTGEERGEEGAGVVIVSSAYQKLPSEVYQVLQRFTKKKPLDLTLQGLRTGREQHVPDSSNHSQNQIKLFNSSFPEGKFGECATSTHTTTNTQHTHTRREETRQNKTADNWLPL